MAEKREDLWTANDKLYHVLFCFSLSLIFTLLAARTPHRFLRRHRIAVGSVLSLFAGAAKEFADYLGFFLSSGASAKDAAADVAGVLLACFVLSLSKFVSRRPDPQPDGPTRGASIV